MHIPASFYHATTCLVVSIIVCCRYSAQAQESANQYGARGYRRERVSWCTTNWLERKKCLDWARAIEEVNVQLEGQEPFELNLDCAEGSDRDQCMGLIDDERADLMLLDAGEIGVAGRYHSLTPIMMELYGRGKMDMGHYSVAVVKKHTSNIQTLGDLFGKKACFSGVNHMASWTLPLASLIDLPQFEIADCNNLVKSASYFFGNSCAPNALINKFNPTGDNPQRMTQLCDRHSRAHSEPYSGPFSALKCLSDTQMIPGSDYRGGDVAFLPHNTVFLSEKLALAREVRLEIPQRSELELLCPQGGRAPIDKWMNCNFGFVPANVVAVSSRIPNDRREKIQRLLRASVQLFSGSNLPPLTGPPYTETQQLPRQSQMQQQQIPSILDAEFGNLNLYTSRGSQQSNPNPLWSRVISNFKLTGDQALINYPSLDVLFSSDMIDLVPLNGISQTLKGYLNSFPVQMPSTSQSQARPTGFGLYSPYAPKPFDNSIHEINSQTDYFEKLRRCSVPAAVLCVTSEKEFNKCQAMSKAFHAAGLKPELNCKLARSTISCMQLIKNRDADLVVLDAADIYLAGLKFSLIPIVAEQIEMYESSLYAVAVAKKSDLSIDLFGLKGKLSCHSGYLKAAGWVMPLNFLLSNDKMRKYEDCDSSRSAAEHFDKSCAPGILSSVSTTQNVSAWTIRNMCELCHGTGRNYCARDASEPFFGDTGSFRCLVEGGGQVAFCKHTAIFENTGGSNRETWARNLIKSDFELLCRDGSRAPVSEYKTCNLGTVPPNAIVTRGDTKFQLIDAYINLFMYGQQYYGSKYSEEYTFKMFSSINGRDLIFQDATQQLVRVPVQNQTYVNYLNFDFLRAMESTYCN